MACNFCDVCGFFLPDLQRKLTIFSSIKRSFLLNKFYTERGSDGVLVGFLWRLVPFELQHIASEDLLRLSKK